MRRVQILVVSRDERVRDHARLGFPSDVDVHLADDSRDAQRIVDDVVPDVVVADLLTGTAGGFNFARDMASDERLRSVPVLILLDRDQDAWLARQAGARVHRTKPVHADVLVADTLSLARGA